MNDNENKKSVEALADEELDKVAGGRQEIENPFVKNNCKLCRHYKPECPSKSECPYGSPLDAVLKLGGAP